MIGRLAHADLPTPLRGVGQERFDAAITFVLMLTQYQTGEELRQREVVSTELAGVFGQDLFAQVMSPEHHHPWRFGRLHPASSTVAMQTALLNKRRTSQGRDRAGRG